MAELAIGQRARIAASEDIRKQCEAAIAAHGEWKLRLKKAIENRGEGLDAEAVAQDNRCVFGQWLYSAATEPHRQTHNYREVRELHRQFHQEAGAIITHCQSGDLHAASAGLENGSRYSRISSQLIQALERWIHGDQVDSAKSGAEQTLVNAGERRTILRYALAGFVFGFFFIGLALGIGFITSNYALEWRAVAELHLANPVLFVVDTAPLVLGAMAAYIGRIIARLRALSESLEIQVQQRTEQVLSQQRERAILLEHIDEGIFSLIPDKTLAAGYSAALEDIFENTELAGRTLMQIFRGRISATIEKELDGYLDLLFRSNHSEEMLRSLNPFDPLRLEAFGEVGHKVLRCRFQRIRDSSGQVTAVLGAAADITAEMDMRERLEKERQLAESQMQLLRQILEIGPAMLSIFREQMDRELHAATELLRSPGNRALSETLEALFRSVHSIKGSASMLGLARIAEAAHRYEDRLAELRKKTDLAEMDFLPLAVLHGNVQKEIADFEDILRRIREFQLGEVQKSDVFTLLASMLERLAASVAAELGKQVALNTQNFSAAVLPEELAADLRDILVQLVRNAIAHGIEDVDARRAAGKSEQGTITIAAGAKRSHVFVRVRDDGAGFAVEKIRERILERGLASEEELSQLSSGEIIAHIFRPGFSTASEADLHSGRGVGLDLVAEKVKKHGGKIRTRWQQGQFTEFILRFPHQIRQQQGAA